MTYEVLYRPVPETGWLELSCKYPTLADLYAGVTEEWGADFARILEPGKVVQKNDDHDGTPYEYTIESSP